MNQSMFGNVKMYAAIVMMAALGGSAGCKVDNASQCGGSRGVGGAGGDEEGGNGIAGGGLPGICHIDECDPSGTPGAQKAACDDDNPQTADRCIATLCGGACAHVEVQCDRLDPQEVQTALCDDGDACTASRCGSLNACEHLPIVNCNPCEAQACEDAGFECGIVTADCTGDGEVESFVCGTCPEPEACQGSGVAGQCGDACESKYSAECAAVGKATTWAWDTACSLTYKYVDGAVEYCTGCDQHPGCEKTFVGDVLVICCP